MKIFRNIYTFSRGFSFLIFIMILIHFVLSRCTRTELKYLFSSSKFFFRNNQSFLNKISELKKKFYKRNKNRYKVIIFHVEELISFCRKIFVEKLIDQLFYYIEAFEMFISRGLWIPYNLFYDIKILQEKEAPVG